MPYRDPLAVLNYECHLCGRLFRLKWQLKDHVRRRHEKQKPFKCEHCPKAFIKNSDLTMHLRSHSDETPYECNFCIRAFKSDTGRIIHEDRHGFNTYTCPNCLKVYNSYLQFIKHKRIHKSSISKMIQTANYECSYCRFVFSSLEFKKNHEMTVHTKKKPIGRFRSERSKERTQFLELICPLCSEVLNGVTAFKTHAKTYHPGRDISHQRCSICMRNIRIQYFPEHMMGHNGIKPHSCEICNAKFVRRHELDHHKTIHIDLKSVECPECHLLLKTNKHLSTHRRYHHSENENLACDICAKVYKNAILLKSHKNRTHYRLQKSEKCNFCNRNIALNNLEKHLRKFHYDEPKLCNTCGISFKNYHFYTIHLQKGCNNKLANSLDVVSCSYCSYTANSKADIRKHCLKMHNHNIFICGKCPYISKTEDSFKKHLILHKAVTNDCSINECCFCGLTTIDADAFQSHMKSHEYLKWHISWHNIIQVDNNISELMMNKLYTSIFSNPKTKNLFPKSKKSMIMINVTKEISWIHSTDIGDIGESSGNEN